MNSYDSKPYWQKYFRNRVFGMLDPESQNLLDNFVKFFKSYKSTTALEFVETLYSEEKILPIDCERFPKAFNKVMQNHDFDFLQKLESKSEDVIPALEFAAHFVCFDVEDEQDSTRINNSEDTNSNQLLKQSSKKKPHVPIDSLQINARFFNLTKKPLSIKDLKSKMVNKFFSVRGTVISVGQIKPIIHQMNLECSKCGTIFPHPFAQGGRYIQPSRCPTQGCKSKNFNPLFSDIAGIKYCDFQKIKVQECMNNYDDESGNMDAGRTPKSIECELTRDLVECCVPGDEVIITGTLQTISQLQYQQDKFGRPTGKSGGQSQNFSHKRGESGKKFQSVGEVSSKRGDKTLFFLYLYANSVQNLKQNPDFQSNISAVTVSKSLDTGSSVGLQTAGSGNLTEGKDSFIQKDEDTHTENDENKELSVKDYQAINFIYHQPDKFKLFVHSVCPHIFGHDIVKAAMVLTLFGGTTRAKKNKLKKQSSGTGPESKSYNFFSDVGDDNKLAEVPIRSDSHLLIVGDPGMGKSQLLLAASYISPRGIYVCGNTTSTSGLTVTVVKDPSSGDWVLEAGALVLADEGCCCIDEFDKMKNEHQALLEAMEQQSISVAKAGIVVSLPSRCCVMAAANPVEGHYNFGKTISENLKINPALLSRFDLIFILVDKPNEERDKMLSDHVMKLHSTEQKVKTEKKMATTTSNKSAKDYLDKDAQNNMTLRERLKMSKEESDDFDPLPIGLFKKYISYAKKYVPRVKLSPAAKETLKEFYISLRHAPISKDCTPVTTRQLESLIRLTQARAKLELRPLATKGDALDAIEIMKSSLADVAFDENGSFDFSKQPQFGSQKRGQSQAALIKMFAEVMKNGPQKEYTKQELQELAESCKFPQPITEEFLEAMRGQSFILRTGSGDPWRYKAQ